MLLWNDFIWWLNFRLIHFFISCESMGAFTKLGVIGAVAVVGVGILCNLPVNPFVKTPEKATLDYLAQTRLKTFGTDSKEFLASELWHKNGAVIMAVRRPGKLNSCPLLNLSLKPMVYLCTLLYMKTWVSLNSSNSSVEKYSWTRKFYGPVERTMLFSGLLRVNVIRKILQTKNRGVEGNMQGEGRILGGVFVIGSGDQGILLEHREREFGDYANLTEVLTAALKIMPNKNNSKL